MHLLKHLRDRKICLHAINVATIDRAKFRINLVYTTQKKETTYPSTVIHGKLVYPPQTNVIVVQKESGILYTDTNLYNDFNMLRAFNVPCTSHADT